MAETAEFTTAISDFMAAWQQATDGGAVAATTENIRRAHVFARGAEHSLSDLAQRYQADGNAEAAANASEAASHCRLAMDALVLAQQAMG